MPALYTSTHPRPAAMPAAAAATAAAARSCLVTTGATAPFPALIRAVLAPEFLDALAAHRIAALMLQAGATYSTADFAARLAAARESYPDLAIEAFDFHPTLGADVVSRADVVVSHAGAGSVLDALRWGKRLVVVENTALMGGHQRELIEELGESGQCCLVEGRLDELGAAVGRGLAGKCAVFPASGSAGLVAVLEEEMGISHDL